LIAKLKILVQEEGLNWWQKQQILMHNNKIYFTLIAEEKENKECQSNF